VLLRYNYQLMTVMVIDDHGHGQPVQHSLLDRNADWHMSRALEHLVRENPEAANAVKVVMVDKALNEIRVLRTYFASTRVLVCTFYVLKYLKLASQMPDYGKISSDDHDAIDVIIHNVVYASSADVYETNRASLKALCTRTGFDAFDRYMDDNWNSCTDMWVQFKRDKLPHFKVQTNNHLESWFGKFKGQIDASMSMTQTVKALIGFDARIANEYMYDKSRVGMRVNRNYDAKMSQVLLFTTHFVAAHIERQYVMASAKLDDFKFDTTTSPGAVVVTGRHASHTVDLASWGCTCSFAGSMRLPCQHAIAYRMAAKASASVIPLTRTGNRYLHVRL
jgi:hypothetical protein